MNRALSPRSENNDNTIETTLGLAVPDPREALSDHVRTALEGYFARLDGHPVNDLYAMVLAEVERPLFETVLRHTGSNQTRAATILGISRSTLRKKLTQYGMMPEKGVSHFKKITSGKMLWNYDNLEPTEKKLIL